MAEYDVRGKVCPLLKRLHAISVENPAYPGTPDVNYAEGWIEVKYERNWPARKGILRIEHFTQQQRVWITTRWRRGGRVCLLLVVAGEWLLFDAPTAAELVGRSTEQELRAGARYHWAKTPSSEEFQKCVLAICPKVKSSSSSGSEHSSP